MIVTPVLKTARLTLRPFQETDISSVHRWCSSPECTAYLFWYPHRTMEDTERLVSSWLKKRKHCSWALDLHGEAIGELEIIKDLKDGGFMFGYILRADQWGQGYMSEALETVLDYMFQNGFRYAYAETDERNTRSRQLLERNGFILTGREEGRFIAKKNERVNIVSYRKEKSI